MVRLFVVTILSFFVLPLHAESRWEKDGSSGCEIWHAFPDVELKIRWKGPCDNGKAHGDGKLVWSFEEDGKKMTSYYLGEMKKGKMNGRGRVFLASGERHFGNFKNDKKHGFGIYSNPDGAGYKGDYRDGKKNGQGVQIWADGSRYEGPFVNDMMHGRGAYYFGSGNRYEGPFVRGKMQGFGAAYYANGNRYEGPFENDQMHGIGSCLREYKVWATCEWNHGEFVRWVTE